MTKELLKRVGEYVNDQLRVYSLDSLYKVVYECDNAIHIKPFNGLTITHSVLDIALRAKCLFHLCCYASYFPSESSVYVCLY